MQERPGCLLQSAGGEANRILLASALSSMHIICEHFRTLQPLTVLDETQFVPAEVLKMIQRSCSSEQPCSTMRCSCTSAQLGCSVFCKCSGDFCINPKTVTKDAADDEDEQEDNEEDDKSD